MKKGFAFLLAIICLIAFCMVPASAATVDAADTVDDDLVISALEIPVYGPKGSATGTIVQGERKTYSFEVTPGDTEMDIQLSWESTSNNLALIFTSPSGVIYGAYDDYYDSSTPNARFGIHIQSAGAVLPHGTWLFDVSGRSVSGSETFTLIINSY
ncbi:MAG TPA: PPC domain-containing protein [Methanocorpusculum sp.]|nr:PPC domain-containing protein [Methanocorpusculum sp.]HJK46962.1 PPC domain-containing protein [Methanocorpusculum sp.]HJK52845.1 PPC domain-containing protein [Methanocorpusculum sp.]HJK69148.1 PPC domain-containing protein [Methanocorpusculum sp.]HJK74297.1 PPC domain-containing protein [Methanocorpusculum sp.]